MVELEVRRKPNMNSIHLNLVIHDSPRKKVQPPKTQQWKPPLRSLQRISDIIGLENGRITFQGEWSHAI